jgi:hypothetical protein
MTLEVLVIGAIRVLGSLPVLRWPLAGGLLAVLVDLSDLLLRDTLDLGGIPDYQSFDKWADQVYLGLFLVVALRWSGVERSIAVALYLLPPRRVHRVRADRAARAAPPVSERVRAVVPDRGRDPPLPPGFRVAADDGRRGPSRADSGQGGPGMGAPRGAALRRDELARVPRPDSALAERRLTAIPRSMVRWAQHVTTVRAAGGSMAACRSPFVVVRATSGGRTNRRVPLVAPTATRRARSSSDAISAGRRHRPPGRAS